VYVIPLREYLYNTFADDDDCLPMYIICIPSKMYIGDYSCIRPEKSYSFIPQG